MLLLLLLGACPTPAGPAGWALVCAESILGNICRQVPSGSPGRAPDSPALLLSLLKPSLLSVPFPQAPHQFFRRVFQWCHNPWVQPLCSQAQLSASSLTQSLLWKPLWAALSAGSEQTAGPKLCCPDGPCRQPGLTPWVGSGLGLEPQTLVGKGLPVSKCHWDFEIRNFVILY